MALVTPWLSIPESCDWTCHAAKHEADLGDDFPMAVGTPIPAPFPGTLANEIRQESPVLYIARITSDVNPSVVVEFMHLSKFNAGQHYGAGETIGWSGGAKGAVGSGQADGPHLHVNAVVNGALEPIRSILDLPLNPTEDGMFLALDPTQKRPDGTALYWVCGNGPAYEFTGTQQQAADFVTALGSPTKAPTAAQWPGFWLGVNSPASTASAPVKPPTSFTGTFTAKSS